MLKNLSITLGVNLASAMFESKKSLTPVPSSLLQRLAFTSYTPPLSVNSDLAHWDNARLESHIEQSSLGSYQDIKGQTTYNESSHDTYVDNYTADLTLIVSNHLQYARSVVYPKVQFLTEAVKAEIARFPAKNAEDFFNIKFYKLPEVFKTALVEEEIDDIGNKAPKLPYVINVNTALTDIDLLSYISVGDTDQDMLIGDWVASVGADKLKSYLTEITVDEEYKLSSIETLNYGMINFLFYRALSVKQDIETGLGLIQLITKTSTNKDYYADVVKRSIYSYNMFISQGLILANDTSTGFSYLSNNRYDVTIYEDSFEKAASEGATLEHVFGYIASEGGKSLTADNLKAKAETYYKTWRSICGLYGTYVSNNRDSLIRGVLKLKMPEAIELNISQEEQDFYANNQGFREKTLEIAGKYIDALPLKELERTEDTALFLIAKIAFRHSNAFDLLDSMLTIVNNDTSLTMLDAVLLTQVRYLTDFMLEQAIVTN